MNSIAPTPHIINSWINDDSLDWPRSIAELVDNSFGVAAGNATEVNIEIDKNKITVTDNGKGIPDLLRLFRAGESESKFSVVDIGKYGIGAKQASAWIGSIYRVRSVFGNKVRAASVNWDAISKADEWPVVNSVESVAKSSERGTRITIERLRKGRSAVRVDYLARVLGESFAPALMDGRSINIIDRRKSAPQITPVVPWTPAGLTNAISFSGEIDGRAYEADAVGILADQKTGEYGLRLCFGHRMIERITKLGDRAIPVRVFGYVRLSEGWKDKLSSHKTKVQDCDDLYAALASHCKALFENAAEYEQEMFIENVQAALNGLFEKLKLDTSGDLLGNPSHSGGTSTDRTRRALASQDRQEEPVSKNKGGTGIKVKFKKMGQEICSILEDDGKSITVVMNREAPLLKEVLTEMERRSSSMTSSLLSCVGMALVAQAGEKGAEWMEKRLHLHRQPNSGVAITVSDWWACTVSRQALQAA